MLDKEIFKIKKIEGGKLNYPSIRIDKFGRICLNDIYYYLSNKVKNKNLIKINKFFRPRNIQDLIKKLNVMLEFKAVSKVRGSELIFVHKIIADKYCGIALIVDLVSKNK